MLGQSVSLEGLKCMLLQKLGCVSVRTPTLAFCLSQGYVKENELVKSGAASTF